MELGIFFLYTLGRCCSVSK